MTLVNEQEERKTVRNRSDGSKSNEATDAELEPVGSIPTTDLSESDDEENEANDDSSLGMYKDFGCGGNVFVFVFQFQFLQSKPILF